MSLRLHIQVLLALTLCLGLADALVKRTRLDGLHHAISSSTGGSGNVHLTLRGRTFLWDNNAAQKVPPLLPFGELTYGVLEFLDVTGGLQALNYGTQPGMLYLRLKMTYPNNKNLRLLGFAQILELRRNLWSAFPSNGFRHKQEGFGPEGFLFGNDQIISSFRLMSVADVELIKLSLWLPFKLYGNLGFEWSFASHLQEHAAMLAESGEPPRTGSMHYSKLPILLGAELKTFNTDFFAELEAELFWENVQQWTRGLFTGADESQWVTYRALGKSFDIHLLEAPIYASTGAKLKYDNGLSLQGGFSWLLSRDFGPKLGPCEVINPCREGRSDGFSPFYPQWKVFGQIRLPLRFSQPSSEMYRSFLLKRQQRDRKTINIEKAIDDRRSEEDEKDKEERLRRLEERRKRIHGEDIQLN